MKGIFLKDIQWFLILDLLEEREEEIISDAGNEFKLCALCIKTILSRLPSGNSDSTNFVGVVLPVEGWYYILDLIDDRVGEIEEEREAEMLETCQNVIWDGLDTDEMPFPEV